MPDRDGCPTHMELKRLKKAATAMDTRSVIKQLRELWCWSDYIVWRGGWLVLHTGGWSGNETLIQCIQDTPFWWLHWRKSTRGGHYWLKISSREV